MGAGTSTGAALAIDEYFEAGEARFLEEVLGSRSDRQLARLAERWYRDTRPFAREALLRYVLDGCDRPRHRPLVKKLFKLAEAAGDDEALGHFIVAFDRLARRDLLELRRWNWQTREQHTEYALRDDPQVSPRDPYRPKERTGTPPKDVYALDRFSRRTRRYLQRRAYRYFRRLGRKDPVRYGRAIREALLLYEDTNLSKPQNLLDAWGLAHVLYWGSPVLNRRPKGIVLAEGRALAEIAPAPAHPAAWRDCLEDLLQLASRAKSRTVRAWTIALLERDYAEALRGFSIGGLKGLLKSQHEEVQTFAAKVLANATGLENLPLSDWLALLEIDNPTALPTLCDLVAKHVSPDRLSLEQAVRLACSRAAPVAELGLKWVRARAVRTEGDLAAVLSVREAQSKRVRVEAAGWVAKLVAELPAAKPAHLRELLDGRHEDVRAPALEVLATTPRFANSMELWGALAESPYADVRAHLVRNLEARMEAFAPDAIRHVWATALLAVHRGGHAKRMAARQVARRVAERPGEAGKLLPLLAVVLRSVRPPERRAALAALCQAAFRKPALRQAIAETLPELKLFDAEAA